MNRTKEILASDYKVTDHAFWWVLVLVWAILILASINRIINYSDASQEFSLSFIIWINVLRWSIVILFVLAFYKLAESIYLIRHAFLIHFLLSLCSAFVVALVFTLPTHLYLDGLDIKMTSYLESTLFNLRGLIVVVPIIYGLSVGFFYYKKNLQKLKNEKVNENKVEQDLIEAKLAVFRSQLDPHFLFNTLQGIVTLIEIDKLRAKKTIGYLSKILNIMKRRKDVQKVRLKQEMEIVDYYLNIEKIRYPEILEVQKNLSSETINALVPTYSIQLLVENAVKHGISRRSARGLIIINSQKKQNELQVVIENSGKSVDMNNLDKSDGIGLSNIKSRLKRMYPKSQINVTKSNLGGLKVCFNIPFEAPEMKLP